MCAGPALAAVSQFELDVLPASTVFESGSPIVIDVGVRNLTDADTSYLVRSQSGTYPTKYTSSYAVQVEYSLYDTDLKRYVIATTRVNAEGLCVYGKSRVSLQSLELDSLANGLARGHYKLTIALRLKSTGLSIPSDIKLLAGMVYTKSITVI
ncbi:MAG: hypothetical protein WCY36_00810 [Candidatus Omnitrophota bacterium]